MVMPPSFGGGGGGGGILKIGDDESEAPSPILWALVNVKADTQVEANWGIDSVGKDGTGHYKVLLTEPLGWGEIILHVTPTFIGGGSLPKVTFAALLGPDQQTAEILFSDLNGDPIDCAFFMTVYRIPQDPGDEEAE